MAKKGKFFVFEGIDGSGKSTQIELLSQKLQDEGHKVYSTCEPTDGQIGKFIRSILKGENKTDEQTIAALFLADRLDHLHNEENGLLKKIEEGYIIICDRYYFSSYAYHSAHVPLDWVIKANSLPANLLKPDLNIFLDLAPEKSMERITKGREKLELFENLDRLTTTRKQFFHAFEVLKEEENVAVINADNPVDTIATEVWLAVQPLL
ncbi:MAG: dTMP kinase [Flavipsychrobacter sp.]